MDVSFLLPTNREKSHPEVLRQAINSINLAHKDLSYEIIVHSATFVSGENVVWIKEDPLIGPLAAFNTMGSLIAKGEYLVCCVDDHEFVNSVQLCIDVVEGPLYRDRDYKIIGLNPNGPFMISCACPIPNQGDRMGDCIITEDLPLASTLRFPVIRKDTLHDRLSGHIFPPDLFYHAGDIWLGYFLSCQGELAVEGPTAIRGIAPLKNSSCEVEDCNTVYKLIKNHLAGNESYVLTKY